MMKPILAAVIPLAFVAGSALAAGSIQSLLDSFVAAGGKNFSADAGKALFQGQHSGGKPDTPSCTTCHTTDPRNVGKTRVGKEIAPMALSKSPDRFSDPAKVDKWFTRNCNTVLGRECTPQEKGDIITYLSGL